MTITLSSLCTAAALLLASISPASAQQTTPQNMNLPDPTSVSIPVDSPAFFFSPGNWVGDNERGGALYRQSWNAGAYFRVYWTSSNTSPTASLLLDISANDPSYGPPEITLNVDGVWTAPLPCTPEIKLSTLKGAGNHSLTGYFANSQQRDRWGAPGISAKNVLRVAGLKVDAGAKPGKATTSSKWLLEIGDSITEGIGADAGRSDNLSSYSYFVGQGLQSQGYEYSVSACGWSGWLHRGDNPPGDVPAYYAITGSTNGKDGVYDDSLSRWNKIDGNNHTLLDSRGHLSAYGATGQEPAVISINYGTNDILSQSNLVDTQASITQSLAALRRAAPKAHIFLIIPFGQYAAPQLKAGLTTHKAAYPRDKKVTIIDLGQDVAHALGANGLWGGLHPNMRGHAVFGARILAEIQAALEAS